MDPLHRQSILQGVSGLAFCIAVIYFAAGTWNYWQGWLFMATMSASTMAFTVYLARYDRALLERRLKVGPRYEKEWSQKIIVSLIYVAFFVFFLLPILDWHFGFSLVPAWVSILGDVMILASFLFIFWVIKTNSWAASNIRVESGQKVVDYGPYAYVRHPMYAGAIWLFVGMPLALGTWWTVLLVIPFIPVLLWRLLDEERILKRDLAGYIAYTEKVHSRLVPGIW